MTDSMEEVHNVRDLDHGSDTEESEDPDHCSGPEDPDDCSQDRLEFQVKHLCPVCKELTASLVNHVPFCKMNRQVLEENNDTDRPTSKIKKCQFCDQKAAHNCTYCSETPFICRTCTDVQNTSRGCSNDSALPGCSYWASSGDRCPNSEVCHCRQCSGWFNNHLGG